MEFVGPYCDWTPEYARQVCAELDQLGIRCYSTHNGLIAFTPERIGKATSLNRILESRYVVLAYPGDLRGLDGWKCAAETLNKANDTLKGQSLHAGYHNHDARRKPISGQKPMELLAATLGKSIMLQLDVGTCLGSRQ